MISGANCYKVYIHTNRVNGKVYVGTTCCSLTARFKKGGLGYRNNKSMWNDIQKYGWENFSHSVLAEGLCADDAYEMEAKLIAEMKSNNPKYGYNVYPGGYQTPSGKDNPTSKSVTCLVGNDTIEYGSIHEASRLSGVSLYHVRKSIQTGNPAPNGATFYLVLTS